MKKKIRYKYFFWAIIFFGTSGVTLPIVMRFISQSDNVLILDEITMNLSTYSVALLAGSVYYGLIKRADSSLSFINSLFDYIGVIIAAILYLVLLNYLMSLQETFFYSISFLTIAGCICSWYFWFRENEIEDFGTSALGNKKY